MVKLLDLSSEVSESMLKWTPPEGTWDVVFVERVNDDRLFSTCCAPWAKGEKGYLDLLSEEAVACFIKYTHEECSKGFSGDFGRPVKGVLTDEPANYRGRSRVKAR